LVQFGLFFGFDCGQSTGCTGLNYFLAGIRVGRCRCLLHLRRHVNRHVAMGEFDAIYLLTGMVNTGAAVLASAELAMLTDQNRLMDLKNSFVGWSVSSI